MEQKPTTTTTTKKKQPTKSKSAERNETKMAFANKRKHNIRKVGQNKLFLLLNNAKEKNNIWNWKQCNLIRRNFCFCNYKEMEMLSEMLQEGAVWWGSVHSGFSFFLPINGNGFNGLYGFNVSQTRMLLHPKKNKWTVRLPVFVEFTWLYSVWKDIMKV